MEEQCESVMDSEQSLSMPRSDYKVVSICENRRAAICSEEKHELAPKRLKKRDLGSLLVSKEHKTSYSKINKEDARDLISWFGEGDMSQVTEVPVIVDSDIIQAERAGRCTFPVEVKPAIRPLEYNTEDCLSTLCPPRKEIEENTGNLEKVYQPVESDRGRSGECVSSKGIGVDLNAVDVSSTTNPDSVHRQKNDGHFNSRNVSECGSSIDLMQNKDPMKIWKEMKQNGYMSSSHGGIPLPKQRGWKSKCDIQNKRIEIAKKEQVTQFTKLASPSGLLNELNPGIINHVRNRKQVHSIIEALVRSEKHENGNAGSKKRHHFTSGPESVGKRKDQEHSHDAQLFQQNFFHEKDGALYPGNKHTKECLVLKNDASPFFYEGKGCGEQYMVGRSTIKSYASLRMDNNKEDTLALSLSSSIKASETSSLLCNEETSSFTGVSSLSVKAASVASQWLELLYQDIKGRLSALQRSKKRVQSVISTELPFLAVKEFSFNQENDPYVLKNSTALLNDATTDIHQKRWSELFEQMDAALSEEEKQLESWLEQVRKMQAFSDQGLQLINGYSNYEADNLGFVENDSRGQMLNKSEKELAVMAAAASIYSTCSYISSSSNLVTNPNLVSDVTLQL